MALPINKIICGDCLEVLRTFPDDCVDCCVSSPPYWGLRNYGVSGQLGLEKTPEEYVAKMVEVFREVRRVLKPTGTLWLNLGDSYGSGNRKTQKAQTVANGNRQDLPEERGKQGYAKQLVGIPWRVAFALQADGWWLRQDIIWAKPNPMPESVTDRCTKAHEYVFLMSKSQHYYFDNEAIKEDSVDEESYTGRRFRTADRRRTGLVEQHIDQSCSKIYEKRNKRSVWSVNVSCNIGSERKEHFATFPEKLIEPMIKAGCPQNGVCFDPFMGAGTVGLVAKKLGVNYVGIELNPKYIKMADARIGSVEENLFKKKVV